MAHNHEVVGSNPAPAMMDRKVKEWCPALIDDDIGEEFDPHADEKEIEGIELPVSNR